MTFRLTALFIVPALVAGCANSPPATTAIRQGGFEWTLPPEFEDDTAYFVQNHHLDEEAIALGESQGVFIDPLMKFESAPRYRFEGGCALARARLTPKNRLRFIGLKELVRHHGQHLQDNKLEFKPTRPLNPFRPIREMRVESSHAIKLAGLNGWQETWQIQWARQAGPTQVASLVTMKMADIANPAELASDRVVLHMVCITGDMDSYVETASHNVLAVADTLKPAP